MRSIRIPAGGGVPSSSMIFPVIRIGRGVSPGNGLVERGELLFDVPVVRPGIPVEGGVVVVPPPVVPPLVGPRPWALISVALSTAAATNRKCIRPPRQPDYTPRRADF